MRDFDRIHDEHMRIMRKGARSFGLLAILSIVLNLALLGAAVFVVVWVLRMTGVIA